MIKLPDNYELIHENSKAVLAHNEHKQEYVAWTKDINGGVGWGHYFSYDPVTGNKKHEAYLKAVKAFEDKK